MDGYTNVCLGTVRRGTIYPRAACPSFVILHLPMRRGSWKMAGGLNMYGNNSIQVLRVKIESRTLVESHCASHQKLAMILH